MTAPTDPAALKVLADTPLCACGCGLPTNRLTRTNKRRGERRGEYSAFLVGHYSRTQKHREICAMTDPNRTKHVGSKNGNWRGGQKISKEGYVSIRINGRYVYEHRIVAGQILGRRLLAGEVVHHKNGNTSDNRPENIHVFASHSEHMKLHMTSDEAKRRGQQAKRALLAALSATGESASDATGGAE